MQSNRIETKFLLSSEQVNRLLNEATKFSFVTEHPERVVCSLYFDNPRNDYLHDNLAGVSKRKKVRLRWYRDKLSQSYNRVSFDSSPLEKLNLEIKIKNNREGTKIVSPITCPKSMTPNCLLTNKFLLDSFRGKLLENGINTLVFPEVFVQYSRSYFKTDQGLRLTVDSKVSFGSKDTVLTGVLEELDRADHVVELKSPITGLKNLTKFLSVSGLRTQRFSKYSYSACKIKRIFY